MVVVLAPRTTTWCWGDLYCRPSKNRAKRLTEDLKILTTWWDTVAKDLPTAKRIIKVQADSLLAHLTKMGVKRNKKTKKTKR